MNIRLTDLGEHNIKRKLINDVIRKYFENYEYGDATYIEIDNKLLVTSCDGYVGSSWLLPFMTWEDVGWKVCSTTISDILVKLARPIQVLVSINIEGHRLYSELESIILGICKFCKEHNILLGKLDLNESSEFSISACAIGLGTRVIGNIIRGRCVLYTVPEFGYTGIVFKLLELNKLWEYYNEPIVRKGVEILRRPRPPVYMLELSEDIVSGVEASTDSSDGLGAVLWSFAENSKCTVRVVDAPVPEEVVDFCRDLKLSVEEVVFNGAEEYLPVIALRENVGELKVGDVKFVPFAYAEPSDSARVIYGGRVLAYRGWEYFRR